MNNQSRLPDAIDRSEPCAFISADYREFQPATFKGYVVEIKREKAERFDTLDQARAYASQRVDRVFCGSSVDNYLSDLKRAQSLN
jgi:hypothetical protein